MARNSNPWQSVTVGIDSMPSRRANPRRIGPSAAGRTPARTAIHITLVSSASQ
jgi:hypothetical protein